MGATNYTTSTTGMFYGDSMSTGNSGARKYIEITSVSFNTSTGVTTLKYNIGIHVDYGNFQGTGVRSSGWSGYDEKPALYDTGWYGYHNGLSATVAYNSTKKFYEWCGYTSNAAGGYIDSEVYLTFKPSLPTYSISYNANSGSGTTSSQTKTWGTALTLNANGFTRSGYTFKRWNTNSSDTGTGYNASSSYTANAAATLYAIWNRTVTYNANGGSNAPSSQTDVATNAITLASAAPTRAGFDFNGWNTASDGTGTSYSAGGSYPANNPNVTLYAQWKSAAIINSLVATRCDSNGNMDDAGGYVGVTCEWENPNNDATIAGTITPKRGTASSFSLTTTADGTSRTSTALFQVDTDTQYTVAVILSVGNSAISSKSTILTKPSFVMDFREGGTGIGIGTAAPASGLEVAWPTTFYGLVEVTSDDIDISGEAPSSTVYGTGSLKVRDKDGETIFSFVPVQTDIGGTEMMVVLHNYVDGTNKSAYFRFRHDPDGTSYINDHRVYNAPTFDPDVLYDNTSGNSGTVSLSHSAADYNHMRIYFKGTQDLGSGTYSSVDVYSPNGKRAGLVIAYPSTSGTDTAKKLVTISGTSITNYNTNYSYEYVASGGYGYSNTNRIAIVRVEAWND